MPPERCGVGMEAPSAEVLMNLTGPDFSRGREQRDRLIKACLEILGKDRQETLRRLAARTAVVTLLAGSGSRWVRSIEAFREEWPAGLEESLQKAAVSFHLEQPRGLFPVPNHMAAVPGEMIPIAGYSLAAVKGLGKHLIMTSGFDEEIEGAILQPLGYDEEMYSFRRQELFQGKPLGHGAAALQCQDFWAARDYVIFNFGGDANNRETLETALLVMAALDRLDLSGGPDLLLPAARVTNPDYTIEVDDQGLPRSFKHAKLTGSEEQKGYAAARQGFSNVGLRIYRSKGLAEKLNQLHNDHYSGETGYSLPENQSNELALDNVDGRLAEEGRARLLAVADPREITPAKTLWAIPQFLKAVEGLWT